MGRTTIRRRIRSRAAAADAVLGYYLRRVTDEPVTDSLPIFGGKERWQIWEKK